MSVEEIQRELLAASTPENQLLADNTEAALRELLETPHGEMLGGYIHSDPSTEFLRRQESFANVREMGGGRPQVWNPHTWWVFGYIYILFIYILLNFNLKQESLLFSSDLF